MNRRLAPAPLQLAALAFLFWAASSNAGVRHFTYLYEAPTSPPGSVEMENWLTWGRTTNPARSDQIDLRHEFEFGVTDKFQASIYVADWFYSRDSQRDRFTYSDTAVELIYNLTNPIVD